ncbi:hypothetical protein LT493_33185 [Streptomyces tricolor]|nr:hypothetical protein [Streptomyces tricolor]
MVRQWNAIAIDTIKTSLGPRPSGQVAIWEGFVSVAVYNAVVGIEGGYELYEWRRRGPAKASSAAAAATAAHDVGTYLPAFKERLDTAYAGHARRSSGRSGQRPGASTTESAPRPASSNSGGTADSRTFRSPLPPAPGVWRPTPRPRSSPSSTPGSPGSAPLLLRSPRQFRPGGPPALSSAAVRRRRPGAEGHGPQDRLGPERAADRRPPLFFSGNLVEQVQSALRDHAARHRLGIAETARLFAAVNAPAADAVVTAWDAKLHYASWRPITAIRLADTDSSPRRRRTRRGSRCSPPRRTRTTSPAIRPSRRPWPMTASSAPRASTCTSPPRSPAPRGTTRIAMTPLKPGRVVDAMSRAVSTPRGGAWPAAEPGPGIPGAASTSGR